MLNYVRRPCLLCNLDRNKKPKSPMGILGSRQKEYVLNPKARLH